MPRAPKQKGRPTSKRLGEKIGRRSAEQVYAELLQEVDQPAAPTDRPLKRRRVGPKRDPSPPIQENQLENVRPNQEHGIVGNADDQDETEALREARQIVYDDSESSSDSSESDVDWNNLVNADMPSDQGDASDVNEKPRENIAVNLSKPSVMPTSRKRSSRLPSTRAEKILRLNVHKLHLCTLLAHVSIRNHWCNVEDLQLSLKNLIPQRTRSFLHPKLDQTQYDRSAQFVRGLEEASLAWRGAFVTNIRGMRRPKWASETETQDNAQRSAGEQSTRQNFINAAKSRSGSRDVGAQLFCALLRSAGVDARLVCSLQLLSLSSGAPLQASTPTKPTVDLSSRGQATTDEDTDVSTKSSTSAGPRRIKRFGRQPVTDDGPSDLGQAPPSAAPKPRRVIDSPYPVFWVEAFNTARQKWVPVDSLVTQTVNKAAKLEPPASDRLNDMTYVVAFEDDGSARDVTQRYVKAYNAKTRKARVEATEGGQRWYNKAMKNFTTTPDDRDTIEDAELSKREADEPMPRNLQDFKDHPYYALERHLRRNEVIHPRREVGKVSIGKGASAVEPIYRRRDVLPVKSADKWYRLGREIKPSEQPLKLARRPVRPQRPLSPNSDNEASSEIALYTASQTDVFIPPPVLAGRIPKNNFGNLDIYVPSMIPPGAVHIRAFDAIAAARALGIDYADAVTGFTFKGRKGTAVTCGIIVAKEYREAMEEVVLGLRWQREKAEMDRRTAEALRLWKRFMVGLRIRERLWREAAERGENAGDEAAKDNVQEAIDESEVREEKSRAEGGFFLERNQDSIAVPTAGQADNHNFEALRAGVGPNTGGDLDLPARVNYLEPTVTSPWDVPGALGQPDKDTAMRRAPQRKEKDLFEEPEANQPGGFLPDADDDNLGGGFFHEDTPTAHPREHVAADRGMEKDDAAADIESPGSFVREDSGRVKNYDEGIGGGGFLPEDDGAGTRDASPPPRMAPPTTEHELATHADRHHPQPPLPDPLPQKSTNKYKDNHEAAEIPIRNENDEGQQDDEDEDRGSLLLEDPEDEDAEPDWLVAETGI